MTEEPSKAGKADSGDHELSPLSTALARYSILSK